MRALGSGDSNKIFSGFKSLWTMPVFVFVLFFGGGGGGGVFVIVVVVVVVYLGIKRDLRGEEGREREKGGREIKMTNPKNANISILRTTQRSS